MSIKDLFKNTANPLDCIYSYLKGAEVITDFLLKSNVILDGNKPFVLEAMATLKKQALWEIEEYVKETEKYYKESKWAGLDVPNQKQSSET
jgi:hypothetical protein